MKIKTIISKKQEEANETMSQIAKLRDRLEDLGVVRKLQSGEYSKKIFAEYVEFTIADYFDLKLADKVNQKGWDAKTKDGKILIQIKENTKSAPKFDKKHIFDYLITVKLNNENFSLSEICVYPYDFVMNNISKTNQTFRVCQKRKPEFQKYIYFDKKKGGWIRTDIDFKKIK